MRESRIEGGMRCVGLRRESLFFKNKSAVLLRIGKERDGDDMLSRERAGRDEGTEIGRVGHLFGAVECFLRGVFFERDLKIGGLSRLLAGRDNFNFEAALPQLLQDFLRGFRVTRDETSPRHTLATVAMKLRTVIGGSESHCVEIFPAPPSQRPNPLQEA